MKKAIMIILASVLVSTFVPSKVVLAGCNIIFSGVCDDCGTNNSDDNGSIPTNETSRTIQAAQELYIHLGSPCSRIPSISGNCYGFNFDLGLGFKCYQWICISGTWERGNYCYSSPDCLSTCMTCSGTWDVICDNITTTIVPTITTTALPTTTSSVTSSIPPTIVELSSFSATPTSHSVILKWETESEIDNAGFNLYRSTSENGEYIKINTSLIPTQGSTTQGASYEFIDKEVKNRKTYYYKLEDIDLQGVSTLHGPIKATPKLIYGLFK